MAILESAKENLKKSGPLYGWIVKIFSPVYSDNDLKRFLKRHAAESGVVLNLGSGTTRIAPGVTNVDVHPYDGVDVVCDIVKLPMPDESADIVVNVAVLEHVEDPESVVREIARVLKKGGFVYSFVPFIQGYHAAPRDFSRRTIEGMRVLFRDFDIVELKPAGGPTSALLWIFQEWVATVLSFGVRALHDAVLVAMMALTFPLKFLDIFLVRHPFAANISSGFTLVGRKR